MIGALGILALSNCKAQQANSRIQHPNVIYVFPDQFRNHAMEFWGQKGFREKINFRNDPVHTPHLNSFARESVVLTSAISNCPLSSPHRGSLLTGLYPNKSGVPLNCKSTNPISSLRDDAECVSDVFSKNGYDCAYFGKLHVDYPIKNDPQRPGKYVGDEEVVWDAYTPKEKCHNFNYWYSYGTFNEHKNPHYWDNDGKKHEPKEWSPLHEAKKVISYLKNEDGVRDPQKPFFIMVGMNPPHAPYRSLNDCMEEDFNLYKDRPLDSLLVRPNVDKTMKKAASTPYYFASITGVDRAFGQILCALKELGMDKNTIVVFSSDHGETMCSQGVNDAKNSPYTEAMNVPFIVRYPEKLVPRVDDLILSTPDVMPTLLGLAGLSDLIPSEVQGKNYAPFFLNEKTKIERPGGALYIFNVDGKKDSEGKTIAYTARGRGFKTAHYTLALYVNSKTKQLEKSMLFDDVNDPYQINNLPLKDNVDIVKEICATMGKTLKEIDDPWYKERILQDMIPY